MSGKFHGLEHYKNQCTLFYRKTNSINFNYHTVEVSIVCTDYMQYLGVVIDSKVCFYQHVNYLSSQP
jgi:hypothetical protein